MQATEKKKFRSLFVQPGLSGSNDLRVGRKMATFQLFFQLGRAKDFSAPLYVFVDGQPVHTIEMTFATGFIVAWLDSKNNSTQFPSHLFILGGRNVERFYIFR